MSDKSIDQWVDENGTRIKAWFVMRRDLEMSTAKFGVQIGHGSDLIHMARDFNPHYEDWISEEIGNRRKIVLGAKTLADLEKIEAQASQAGMTATFIRDAGLTEFGKETVTGLVIHPHPDNAIPASLKRAQAWKD